MSPRRTALAARKSEAAFKADQVSVEGAVTRDVASAEALKQLYGELDELRLEAALPLLKATVKELEAGRYEKAADYACKAIALDEGHGYAWYVLAICQEKLADFTAALLCYERALELMPDHQDLTLDLGRLAFGLRLPEMAEKFFAHHLARNPGALDSVNNLACALRDQSRFVEALELLRPYIYAHPDQAILWNTLGSVLAEQGDMRQALTFYDEALRLNPAFAAALHNRANARMALEDAVGALADADAALALIPTEAEGAVIRFARSHMLMLAGEIKKGWEAYEVRHEPGYLSRTHFALEGPRVTDKADLKGKRLLVVGEQGLGDEVLFAHALPDVLEALGPDGRLLLAVERRLVPLMQRSFPHAQVFAHGTWGLKHHIVRGVGAVAEGDYDLWTPIGSLMPRFRPTLEAFGPERGSFLRADPERVAHWRGVLDGLGGGPKVGVMWKSLRMEASRSRFFSPFDLWRQVLETPAVTFVNLQYGDCAAELAQASRELGKDIVQLPGIDLKEDLDDVAALCVALDLTVGPASATTNLGAAAGATTWMISTPDAWTRLGTDHYPWYPQVRTFAAPGYNWSEVMGEVAAVLAETFPAH